MWLKLLNDFPILQMFASLGHVTHFATVFLDCSSFIVFLQGYKLFFHQQSVFDILFNFRQVSWSRKFHFHIFAYHSSQSTSLTQSRKISRFAKWKKNRLKTFFLCTNNNITKNLQFQCLLTVNRERSTNRGLIREWYSKKLKTIKVLDINLKLKLRRQWDVHEELVKRWNNYTKSLQNSEKKFNSVIILLLIQLQWQERVVVKRFIDISTIYFNLMKTFFRKECRRLLCVLGEKKARMTLKSCFVFCSERHWL